MRRSAVLLLGLGVLIAVIVAGIAAAAEGEAPVTAPIPTLEMQINVGFSPKALPPHEAAPVSLTVGGEIADRTFGQPPPLRELTMELDKGIAIHTAGIPACRRGRLGESTDTADALAACRPALIGEGESAVVVHYDETEPIKIRSRLLVFKGGEEDGKTTLFLHAYFSDPIYAAVVVPVTIASTPAGASAPGRSRGSRSSPAARGRSSSSTSRSSVRSRSTANVSTRSARPARTASCGSSTSAGSNTANERRRKTSVPAPRFAEATRR
jgi:hypothetical protein